MALFSQYEFENYFQEILGKQPLWRGVHQISNQQTVKKVN